MYIGRYADTKTGKVTRLYTAWLNMRNRCNNKNCHNYKDYGGRGISVASEWDSFEKFDEWSFKNGYNDTLTLDRIDNEKGYSPDNCRWVSVKVQANNRRSSVKLTHNGETHTLAEWADLLHLNYKTFTNRIYRGYPENQIFETGMFSHNGSRKKGNNELLQMQILR